MLSQFGSNGYLLKKTAPPFLLLSMTLHGIEQLWTIWLSCPGHVYPQLLDTPSLLAAGNVGRIGKTESLDAASAIAKTLVCYQR